MHDDLFLQNQEHIIGERQLLTKAGRIHRENFAPLLLPPPPKKKRSYVGLTPQENPTARISKIGFQMLSKKIRTSLR